MMRSIFGLTIHCVDDLVVKLDIVLQCTYPISDCDD